MGSQVRDGVVVRVSGRQWAASFVAVSFVVASFVAASFVAASFVAEYGCVSALSLGRRACSGGSAYIRDVVRLG